MSHLTTLKTEIRDQDILIETLQGVKHSDYQRGLY